MSPNHGSPPSRHRRQPRALEESEELDAAQRRPPPAIYHGFCNPPRGVVRGRAPEDFRSLRHGVGKGKVKLQRVRRQQQ